MSWFRPCSPVELYKFELVGLLFSLAIYNGAVVTANFPMTLYKQLLHDRWIPETPADMMDGWPEVASGLQSLLDWDEKDGSVEDVFVLEYEFAVSTIISPPLPETRSDQLENPPEHLDGSVDLPLESVAPDRQLKRSPPESDDGIEGGSETDKESQQTDERPEPATVTEDITPETGGMVTAANRKAYVRDYIRWLTCHSVEPQFQAFARGFHTLIDPKAIRIITPPILQLLTEGSGELDVRALQNVAKHKGWPGGMAHPLLDGFWKMVKQWSVERQQLLLKFVTASDRVPAMGYSGITFVIERNGGDSELLPSSSTCFGMLMMPEYSSAEKMEKKLVLALENCEGFGVP